MSMTPAERAKSICEAHCSCVPERMPCEACLMQTDIVMAITAACAECKTGGQLQPVNAGDSAMTPMARAKVLFRVCDTCKSNGEYRICGTSRDCGVCNGTGIISPPEEAVAEAITAACAEQREADAELCYQMGLKRRGSACRACLTCADAIRGGGK